MDLKFFEEKSKNLSMYLERLLPGSRINLFLNIYLEIQLTFLEANLIKL